MISDELLFSKKLDAEDFSTCIANNFVGDQAAVEMEVVNFQNDLSLRSLSTTGNIWPLDSKQKYLILVQVELR